MVARASLVQFLAWSQEREWFDQHVEIVMGNNSFAVNIPLIGFHDRTDQDSQ